MDYEKIIVNLEFIYLLVFIKESKIFKTEILLSGFENFEKKHKEIIDEIKKYFYGEKSFFDLNLLSFDNLTSFQKEVLVKLSKIPRGKVTTYKSLAIIINKEKSQRAVGNVLRKNPFPIIIPCHRVIKSDLSVGEFGYGIELKKKLLMFEGVKFNDKNKASKESVL